MASKRLQINLVWMAIGFALFVLVTLMFMMSLTTLWDRDESIYARTSVEMLESGSYLVPTFNGEVFAEKPPLIFWLMALSIRVFGVNEFAVRFISAIGLMGAGIFTFMMGRRMFGQRVAFWSSIILLTASMSFSLGMSAILDDVLLCWITMTVWAFVELVYRPDRWPGMMLIFVIGLTLAQLTKGPVGPAVVGALVILTACFARKEIPLKWPHYLGLFSAVCASFAIFLAWAISANNASGGEVAKTGFSVHVIGRALHPMQGHGGKGVVGYLAMLPIYLPAIIVGFIPWTIQLPGALSALAGRRIGGHLERTILWAWIGPTFIMFSLVATKLPHYILPLFPALAIITAAGMEELKAGRLSDQDHAWFHRGIWFFLPVIFGLGLVLLIVPWIFMLPTRAIETLPGPLALFVLGWMALQAQRKLQIEKICRVLAVAFPLIIMCIQWTTIRAIEPIVKISPAVAQKVRTLADSSTPIYMRGYTEPSLFFYLNRPVGSPIKKNFKTSEDWEKEFKATPKLIFISTQEYYAWASRLSLDPPIREFARFKMINTNAKGRREVVVVSGRGIASSNFR